MKLNREGWLTNLAELMIPRIEEIAGKKMPDFRVSMSFPTRNALGLKTRVVGQCHSKYRSRDKTFQLLISPLMGTSMDVAETVAHEMGHAIVGVEHGHKKPFVNFIRPLGLLGKPTATHAGKVFKDFAEPLIAKLGPYPHTGMVIDPKYKQDKGRMVKAICPMCDYKVRMTRTWLDQKNYGPPICPSHMIQMIEV